ncbi:MAG: hypothetical protein HS115_12830 [Spirochaetales bacterium]|nr:hypothetical protein [Spirochaetales bacterium]
MRWPALFLLLSSVACKDIERPPLLPYLLGLGSGGGIGVVSSDLGAAGRFSAMTADGIPRLGQISIHSDAIARYANDRVYIINRLNRNNIQVLNPRLLFLTETEFSTGSGSNPHDLALVHPGLAFVTLYERSRLAMVNPAAGVITGEIDLSGFADSDGIPEMSGIYYTAGRIFVALQRLDRSSTTGIFPPTGHSSLLELEGESGAVIAEHILPATNPFGKIELVSLFGQEWLALACPAGIGANFDLAGGIVLFQPEQKTFRPGFVYSESSAGGDILAFAIKDDGTGYAAVQFSDFSTAIQRFNPTTGAKEATLAFYPGTAGYVAGMLIHQGKLYVGDASFSRPGITIYDTVGDNKLTPTPVEVGLRPTDLIVIP